MKISRLEDGLKNANSVDDTFFLRRIEVDLDFLEGNTSLNHFKSKQKLETVVSTMYKRKDRIIHPVNIPLAYGLQPVDNAMTGHLTDLEYQKPQKKSKSFFVRDEYLYEKGKHIATFYPVVGLRDQK